MRADPTPARERLDAWRQRHADRLDPLRFGFIEALARRADAHHGAARRLLEQRLSALLDAYAADLAGKAPKACDGAAKVDAADTDAAPAAAARSRLGELLSRFASDTASGTAHALPPPAAALPALEEARTLWTELRGRSQMRQSLQQAPTGAGPLNSGVLVHRSLALMRTLSPGYLQHFLAYVDALSWLQQLHDGGALASQHAPGAAVGKPPARGKPRKRS